MYVLQHVHCKSGLVHFNKYTLTYPQDIISPDYFLCQNTCWWANIWVWGASVESKYAVFQGLHLCARIFSMRARHEMSVLVQSSPSMWVLCICQCICLYVIAHKRARKVWNFYVEFPLREVSRAYTWMNSCTHACTRASRTIVHSYVCVYTNACMHICMTTCAHRCMHACMHECMYVCGEGYSQERPNTPRHPCRHTHVNKNTHM